MIMGIATPMMERYALGPLIYHDDRYLLEGHVTKLLCQSIIDDVV
jgi:hypothetical protein